MSNLPDGFGSLPCDTQDNRSPWADPELTECQGCHEWFDEEEEMAEVTPDAYYCVECFHEGNHK